MLGNRQIRSKNQFIIEITALSVMAVLMAVFAITQYEDVRAYAKDAVVDLNDFHLDKDNVQLRGEFEFYYQQFIEGSPSAASFTKPIYISIGSWNNQGIHPELSRKAFGYGTYHLRLSGLEQGKEYAIDLGEILSAYNLWIDDEMILSVGVPGKSMEETTHRSRPRTTSFKATGTSVDLFIEVANFKHCKAGIIQQLQISEPENISILREKALGREFTLMSIIFAIALYNFLLFLIRPKHVIYLFFTLLCIGFMSRQFAIGAMPVLVVYPNIGYLNLQYMIYCGDIVSAIFIILFIRESLKPKFPKAVLWISLSLLMMSLVATSVLPLWYLWYIQQIVHIILLSAIFFTLAFILNEFVQKQTENALLFAGLLFLSITIVHGWLVSLEVIHWERFEIYGYFIFVLLQSIYGSHKHQFTSIQLEDTRADIEKISSISQTQLEQSQYVTSRLMEVRDKISDSTVKHDLTEIARMVSNRYVDSEVHYSLEHIHQANTEFYNRLATRFPDLTKGETVLCGYLKAGYSNKKIADIRHISPDSVKKSRNRLRKKMKLTPEVDIYHFVQTI